MKLMWVCNMKPGEIQKALTGKEGSANWLDHVLADLAGSGNKLHVLCRGGEEQGSLDENRSFACFRDRKPYQYLPEVEAFFQGQMASYKPDVIHIWGTEYAHTFAAVNAAEKLGLLDRVVISIQGLCSVCALHYAEGVPQHILRRYTFRDLLRRDNIRDQIRAFARRGYYEVEALKKVRHVIGRTEWDRACVYGVNPGARYHFCNETLRHPFYEGGWDYAACTPHRIFASSCVYPVKGFHYLLHALAELKKEYPDATLAVTGKSFLDLSFMDKLHRGGYHKYLAQLVAEYHLEDSIEFLGKLSPEGMKEQYLKANVFALPSTIENSPNSLGEAMLLGTPCVAADVGGVTTLMRHESEGYVYQSTAPYMLAHYIRCLWESSDKASEMGQAARLHARQTHAPDKNIQDLLRIYTEVASCIDK